MLNSWQTLIARDGEALFLPQFPNLDDSLFDLLERDLSWQQDHITLFGQTHSVPRLQAWYGDFGADYGYSGMSLQRKEWDQRLLKIKHDIEWICEHSFNSVLANLYRDGRDKNGWHSDDEIELGENPVIASLSLGATRRFQLRHKRDGETVEVSLPHASLLVMKGELQKYWKHQIPVEKKIEAARINLTFRLVKLKT
jgi:alkylated DNA repair dioxygenase AlkB